MAEASIVFLLQNLKSLTEKRIGRLVGVDKQMDKFSSMLSAISAVLEDAEEKQWTDRAVKDWLQKLSDACCELDDALDDCELEAYKLQNHTWARTLPSSLSCLNPTNIRFRVKIANKMKEIGERLDQIADERIKFHLRESVGETRRVGQAGPSRETSSIIAQSHVYGRDDDRERVVGFLVNDAANCEDISVFAIVGLGGLGKTTLAQLVFNDERVSEHFEVKIWVCVSEDFDVKRLVKAIIESATRTGCEALDMDPRQKRLQDVLKGKRFLLVLDDVWNEDQEEWGKLKYVLDCGSSGSSLIVTTRLKKVASIMGTVPMHQLSGLSEDDCWSLFKQRAFANDKKERPDLVKIGKEIVKKCKGRPLAAKALGGLMRFKEEESEWLSVMHSKLWNLPEDKVPLLPALRLSYFHLLIEQRRCFVYCAIFPKDYDIQKEQLIRLWMANGLICSKRGIEVEDIGSEIFDELCWRLLIQEETEIYGNVSYSNVRMHDLVHDLAQSVIPDEFCTVEVEGDASPVNLSKRVRHLVCHRRSSSGTKIQITQNARSVRTFLMLGHGTYDRSYNLKFRSLRAFDAKILSPSLPISTRSDNLKHLRYLNLSYSKIKILPNSICSLHHLSTLDLSFCGYLLKLPKRMSRLKGLRHLDIRGCEQLSHMPLNIARLTCLKTLTNFIVSRRKGCHLDELCDLNIGGYLEIRNLEKAVTPVGTKSAVLSGKRNLKELHLSWNVMNGNESQENQREVLEALEPSRSLSILSIRNYNGVYFSYWLSNRILGNVTSITLSNCKNCLELPSLGNLTLLRDLEISGMDFVRYVDKGQLTRSYVQLKSLCLNDLPSLESLSRQEGTEMFPCLSFLYVNNCPKLVLPVSESVKDLIVYKATDLLLNSIRNLRGLFNLCMYNNDSMSYFPPRTLENLIALRFLTIEGFKMLQDFSTDALIGCSALERLNISSCHELKSVTEGKSQSSSSLKHITIDGCTKLKSISDIFGDFVALQSLELFDCPELKDFPLALTHLSSLQTLTMSGQRLVHLPEAFRYIPSLESMSISYFKELASLPDWLGDLQSLRELYFVCCPAVTHVPTSFKRLTNLQKLKIESCPKLEERCREEVGEDWHRISHIPNVYIGP